MRESIKINVNGNCTCVRVGTLSSSINTIISKCYALKSTQSLTLIDIYYKTRVNLKKSN